MRIFFTRYLFTYVETTKSRKKYHYSTHKKYGNKRKREKERGEGGRGSKFVTGHATSTFLNFVWEFDAWKLRDTLRRSVESFNFVNILWKHRRRTPRLTLPRVTLRFSSIRIIRLLFLPLYLPSQSTLVSLLFAVTVTVTRQLSRISATIVWRARWLASTIYP